MSGGREAEIARILLEQKAVTLSVETPYTWSSGMRSPVYCDNRLLISTVDARRRVMAAFRELVEALPEKPEVIAGTATAGIPHAAWLAEALDLPMVYVRSAEKKHGKKNLIEGRIQPGQRTVVIEDLISTGGSSVAAAKQVADAGGKVMAVFAIFQYGLPRAKARFDEAGYSWATLTNLEVLIGTAVEMGYLDDHERAVLNVWRQDPAAWSERYLSAQG